MWGMGPERLICRWKMCIGTATVGYTYCEKHASLRAQHSMSHKAEGHGNPIELCPRCEDEQEHVERKADK